MRSLIRPALFMMARLGLLFSVIAFVFGQTWQGAGYTYKLALELDRAGMAIVFAPAAPVNWGMQVAFEQNLIVSKRLAPGDRYFSFGPVAIRYRTSAYILAAYHWLIITVTAVFYAGLKWAYWKPKKAVVTEGEQD